MKYTAGKLTTIAHDRRAFGERANQSLGNAPGRTSAIVLQRKALVFAALSLALSACQTPGFNAKDLEQATAQASETQVIEGIRIEPITVAALQPQVAKTAPIGMPAMDSDAAAYEYRIGVGDSLGITLWDHPELSDAPVAATGERSAAPAGGGRTVTAMGTIFFPLVGEVQVQGRTVGAIRELLAARLAAYIKNPQVDVRVAAYRSQRVIVTGAVHSPGVVTLNDVPLSIFDALAQAGGAAPNADLSDVQLVRAARSYTLDVPALLEFAVSSPSLTMRAGDLLNVPDSAAKRVHVLGEIRQAGSYPMRSGRLTLADALGAAGGLDAATANPGRIYVFRRERDHAVAHWLDAISPATMVIAAEYQLQPQDVVYVAAVPFTRYNRALAQLLPTLQALWQTAITSREFR
ncbi:polysaccharide biosynthesis/export family protein [Povalibacter sp.]|uniref:polysaccharide biosynthesis/export family protein n=1 Tax=Povalibacter sp. TaxID=1962978 RepID=UPI002F3F7854